MSRRRRTDAILQPTAPVLLRDGFALTMYVCILDTTGQVLVHRNVPSTATAFLEAVASYRADLVLAVECLFTWYWLADLCAAEGIAFVLGHALAMKAILAHTIGRAVYYMHSRGTVFSMENVLAA